MKTKNSQESQRLLDSVKENYNNSDELDLRRKEVEYGLAKSEQAFVEKFPAGSCLLDIGCASGRVCLALVKLGYTVTGIDVAEKQIVQAQQFAEEGGIDVTFLHYEPPTLPFPDASFAAAFLGNVYCYVPHRAVRIAFLEEVARVLYPNGQLSLFQSILDNALDSYEEVYDDNYHQFASDYETLEEGDGFTLGSPNYVHYFFEADLRAELEESPFQILDSSTKGVTVSYIMQKHGSDLSLR